ncbi:S-locus-specific glycoprotein S13-like [Papaver somniferum]|uniref:S-locus-specific glycoprotein S13-like n=1 Tax=Papaver somniferum TaxID=3469 RepID=UPI000E701FE2|nr:S-locus-specific glycoprotein S13-like [Papaver somniferum]
MNLQVQQFMFSLSLLLLLVSFIGVESSNDHFISNRIKRGSSLSPNGTRYWLSDSGNIAFGFYPLPCTSSSITTCIDQYVVGIWFVNSPHKTLVWTANRDDPPLSNLYSLIITEEGNFLLRADNKDKPLIDVHRHIQPVSYAKMHDNGYFVLYNAESQIIWESFDYPTDTILGGQVLKDDVDMVSGVSLFNPGSGEYKQ